MVRTTRFIWHCLGAIMALVALTGCGRKEAATPPPTSVSFVPAPQATPLPPLPTTVAAGSDANPLVLSLVVDDPDAAESDAADLAAAISEDSGLTVEVSLRDDAAASLVDLCGNGAALATLDALNYLKAQEESCGDLLYQVQVNGADAQQGQIVSLADRIFTLPNVRDRIYCRSGTSSMIGWVEPALLLQANGINPFTDLARMVDVEDDDAVLAGLLDGTCDVGAVAMGAQDNLDNPGAIGVIAEMAPVPNMGVVLSAGLSAENRAALEDALDISREELAALLNVDALVDGDDTAYNGLRDLFTAAGVDSLALSQ